MEDVMIKYLGRFSFQKNNASIKKVLVIERTDDNISCDDRNFFWVHEEVEEMSID